MRIITAAFTALAVPLSALVLLGGVANASPTPDGNPHTTQYLGGYVASGTQRITNVRDNPVDMPDLGTDTALDNTVADGVTLAPSTGGGTEYGIGLVWNASTTTCATGQYTLEAGEGTATAPAAMAVPLSDLSASEAQILGSDVCVSPGQSDMFSVYQSTGAHEILFAATVPGTGAISQDKQIVLSWITNVDTQFFAAGIGTDATAGTDVRALPDGTVADFGGIGNGLTYIGTPAHHRDGSVQNRVTFDSDNMFLFEGTVSGGAASPLTMSPSVFGTGSVFSVAVP